MDDPATPPAAQSRASAIRYLAAVLLLPWIVLWRQDNSLFTGYGYLDPWFYLGFFRNLAEFKRNLFPGTYYGSRLAWILPGAAVYRLFSPVTANCVLHLGVHTVATVALFLTLKWLAGARPAFLAAMLFSVNPWLWAATGWDNPDGAGIAYCLLTVALLTWAALQPGRRFALMAAGMALACLVYTHLYWVTLAWLLPLSYIAFTWALRRTPVWQSFLTLCVWFGAGCVLVTVAFGAINRSLDGHFFFYAPSVLEAFRIRGNNLQWFDLPWANGAPALWLLFAAVAAVSAVWILLSRSLRSEPRPSGSGLVAIPNSISEATRLENTAAVVFAAQFLCALAWMAYTQSTGNPVLGIFYYAGDLMPFTFLVIGIWFWPSLDSLSRRSWAIVCAAAAALCGLAWLDGVARLLAGIPHVALAGIFLMTLSLRFRRHLAGVILSLAGAALLLAPGVASRYAGLDPHAFRRQFESISAARSRVETVRRGAAVRFWYDQKDRALPDATALSSTYLWSGSLLAASFTGTLPGMDTLCDVELVPSTVVAAISSDGRHGPGFVQSALAACWQGKGLRATPLETDAYDRTTYRYSMALLRVEPAPGAWIPLRPVFDSAGHGVLLDAATGQASEFPVPPWTVQPGDSRAYLRPGSGGVLVQTHAAPSSLAALYTVLRAPLAGRYRFAMRYWRIAGAIHFGAYSGGRWLASATRPYWDGKDPNLVFWIDLAAGQEFQLAIDNHNEGVQLPASFVMKGITAIRVGPETP